METRFRVSVAVATLLAALYAALWCTIDYLQERAFSLHIWDVGANYVLTAGTSPPDLDYGHLTSAPQNPIYLLFGPLVRIFPDPMTLVQTENILMAIGGIFIFLIAAHVWQRPGLALLMEGLYLFSYALFGAPFYPNHYEVLFSVFFPIAYYLHLRAQPALAALFLVLAAMCSSLATITTFLFVLLLLGPRFVSELRGRGYGLGRFLLDHANLVAVGVACVAIFLLPFALVGPATTLSYAHLAGNPSSPNLLAGLESYGEVKVAYLAFLAVAFVPVIFRSRLVLLAAPYFALALLAGSDHYGQFTYQYTYTVGAVLFIAWIEALRFRYARVPWPRPTSSTTTWRRLRSPRRWHVPGRVRQHPELAQLTLVGVALGILALPYSPGNAWAGNYYSIPFHNYNFPALTTATPYDRALWNMAQSVPLSSSVLIEEDMPMLTNRAVWYEPGSYNGESVDYVVADPSNFWFTFTPPPFIGPFPIPMITSVNQLYSSGSYGIVQEYQGAILFEHGYVGAPQSFAPFQSFEPGIAFVGPNATRSFGLPGTVSLTDRANQTIGFRTEAPMVIPPGQYTLSMWLRSTNASPSDHATIGLWENATNPRPFLTLPVRATEFSANSSWELFETTFGCAGYVQQLYYGALDATWTGTISLRSVYLNQTSPL
jgi:uncharacterized membrane protein